MSVEKVNISHYDLWDYLIDGKGPGVYGKPYAVGYAVALGTKENMTEAFFARDKDILKQVLDLLSRKIDVGCGIRIHKNIWEKSTVKYHDGQIVLHKHINV